MTTAELVTPPMTGAVFSSFEIRDMDTKSGFTRLAGRAVPYNRVADVGPFTEEFTSHAFGRSVQQQADGLPLLLFHNDRGWPIGISESWQDLKEGLDGVWRLDRHEDAQRAAQLASDGILRYMSVRFQQDPGRFEFVNGRDKPHFRRHSARMIETSVTATPVYMDSVVSWVRSSPSEVQSTPALNEWRTWLDQVKQGAG